MSLRSLRRKLPGFERKLGNMIADMAAHDQLEQGFAPNAVHGWTEVKPASWRDPLDAATQSRWIAFMHVKVYQGDTYTLPIIPDEFNPREDKLVRTDDTPHMFLHMHEAEAAANKELPAFIQYIKGQL